MDKELVETEFAEAKTPLNFTVFSDGIGLKPVPVNVIMEPGKPELFETALKFSTENFCTRWVNSSTAYMIPLLSPDNPKG